MTERPDRVFYDFAGRSDKPFRFIDPPPDADFFALRFGLHDARAGRPIGGMSRAVVPRRGGAPNPEAAGAGR